MPKTYTTVQGDTWDTIAKIVYGKEANIGILMAANFPLLDVFMFDAGETVVVPDLPEDMTDDTTPEWRTAT